MKLKKVKIKKVTHYIDINDYQMSTVKRIEKEPFYTLELTSDEYQVVMDLFKALDKCKGEK